MVLLKRGRSGNLNLTMRILVSNSGESGISVATMLMKEMMKIFLKMRTNFSKKQN